MRTIGRYEYPDLSIEDAAKAVASIPPDGLPIGDLGDAENELLLYGLLKRDDKRVIPTTLAAQLLESADDSDRADALLEALLEVPLFRALHVHCRERAQPEPLFVAVLLLTTHAKTDALEPHLPTIRDHMNKIAQLRSSASTFTDWPTGSDPEVGRSFRRQIGPRRGMSGLPAIEISAPGVLHRFPFTPAGVDQMMRLLERPDFGEFLRAHAEASLKSTGEGSCGTRDQPEST